MLKKILIYIFWVILAVYMLFSLVIIPNIPDNNQCKGVLITVDNDENGNLGKENITELLDKEGLNPYGYISDSIRCTVIENCINEISLVRDCQVYKTADRYVAIEIDCKIPILKVNDINGNEYYIDSDGNIITGVHKALHLPVATGHISEEMQSTELKEMACAIYGSRFWLAQTEQIHFEKNGNIILVPRVGGHIIEFGKAENITGKLDKLYTFYTKGLNAIGWDKYEKLNIEFNDKVICTKKN